MDSIRDSPELLNHVSKFSKIRSNITTSFWLAILLIRDLVTKDQQLFKISKALNHPYQTLIDLLFFVPFTGRYVCKNI